MEETCIFEILKKACGKRASLNLPETNSHFKHLIEKDSDYFEKRRVFRLPKARKPEDLKSYYDFKRLSREEVYYLKHEGVFHWFNAEDEKQLAKTMGFLPTPSIEELIMPRFGKDGKKIKNYAEVNETSLKTAKALAAIIEDGFLDMLFKLGTLNRISYKQMAFLIKSKSFAKVQPDDINEDNLSQAIAGVRMGLYPNLVKYRPKLDNDNHKNWEAPTGFKYGDELNEAVWLPKNKSIDYLKKCYDLPSLTKHEIRYLQNEGYLGKDLSSDEKSYLRSIDILAEFVCEEEQLKMIRKGQISLLDKNSYCSRNFPSCFDSEGKLVEPKGKSVSALKKRYGWREKQSFLKTEISFFKEKNLFGKVNSKKEEELLNFGICLNLQNDDFWNK